MPNEPWDIESQRQEHPTYWSLGESIDKDELRYALAQRSVSEPSSENSTPDKKDKTFGFKVSSDQMKLAGYVASSRHLPFRTLSDYGRFTFYLGNAALLPLAKEKDPPLSVRMEQALMSEELTNATDHKDFAFTDIERGRRVLADSASSHIEIVNATRLIEKYAGDSDNRVRDKAGEIITWQQRMRDT